MQISGQAKGREKEEELDESVLDLSAVPRKVLQGHRGVIWPSQPSEHHRPSLERTCLSSPASLSHGLVAALAESGLCQHSDALQRTAAGVISHAPM